MNLPEWQLKLKDSLTAFTTSREKIEGVMDIKTPHIPKRLFKCRGVTKHAMNNLIEKTLFCASPDTFNDPYECALQANLSPDIDFEDLFAQAEVELDSLQFEELQSVVKTHFEKMSNEVSASFRTQMMGIYKICSLSERIDSILMWSHYADDHKGFAMEYDFHELPRRERLVRSLWPVLYDSEMLDVSHLINSDARPDDFNNLFGIAAAIQKTEDWQYEKEWRLITHDTAPLNVPAPLKAIYIGARAARKDKDALIAAANFAGVPVFQMRLAERRFAMTYDPA
ncbi:DUF2971 domain-containing protein [Pseudomonas syringae]|uniref:DUF2971 domain-containing protein n=1 Tax=Pseudomonas syringae TaxID=317 RepID=UPI001BCCF5C6|nr:DUF2971 domain-containing protein [Pseudomonas syringae]MBS7421477.1 DUF2971 domain-containing protein [Pseudomonas syringae]MBS7433236.1 DUF2971 domain-containing protein [Pseudomonas syringae]QVI79392.1 DUF2971 domain-containing protein [Pseudomonas syringae]